MVKRILLFSLGILLSIFIISSFGDNNRLKDTFFAYINYFDVDERVLYHLRTDSISLNQYTEDLLEVYQLTKGNILEVLQEGKVNFKKSQTERTPCQYFVIEDFLDGDYLSVKFEYCDTDQVTVVFFELLNQLDS